MLSVEYCKQRQQRLLEYMQAARLDAAILTSARMVYYFSGALVDPNWPQAFVLTPLGSALISNQHPRQSVTSDVRLYTGYTIERPFSRQTMQEELDKGVLEVIGTKTRRVGLEFDSAPARLTSSLNPALEDLTAILTEMRRRKDPDELDCMRNTVALTETGYAAVRELLKPGMTEIQAYSIIHEAITQAAHTSVELKGDFACGVRAINGGGPPTDRHVEPGELYILDLFPIYEGYMCDLCRTFAVGKPEPQQQEAWAHVLGAHRIATDLIRPGNRAGEVYREIRAYLDRHTPARGSFTHHAGHGVGIEGWEQPWLNAGSDQTFVEGEVIACEPALYSQHLHGGIRLEHNYLVTADVPIALDSFPMDL